MKNIHHIIAYLKRRHIYIFAFCVSLISLSAFFHYYQNGDLLIYNDARSHLNIARRVVDNIQPGIAQFGGIWLPLYHMLILPFVLIDPLWRSGIAGSIVSMMAHIFASCFMYLLAKRITKNMYVAFILGMLYASNPSILFLQSIPMTESLTLCCVVVSIYFFYEWLTNGNMPMLFFSALFTMLATLIRYDGWFLCAVQVFVIVCYLLLKKSRYKKIEGTTLFFATLATFGASLWFLWQIILWGDPLHFLSFQQNAGYQQTLCKSAAIITPKHNMLLSIATYWYAIVGNIGMIPSILAILMIVIVLVNQLLKKDVKGIVLLFILGSLVFFNTLSLYLGISIIYTPETMPGLKCFDVRYGIMALPLLIILGTYSYKASKYFFYLFILIIIFQNFFIFNELNITPLIDGRSGVSSYNRAENNSIEEWFTQKYDGGLVMISTNSEDPIITSSGLQMKQFMHEGVYRVWNAALKNPSKYVKYIVISNGDSLWTNTMSTKDFKENFKLTFQDGRRRIFKRVF